VVTLLTGLIEDHPDVDRVAVGLPGHLSPSGRATAVLPNVAGDWSDHPLADRLEQGTGRQVQLLNDARAFAAGELALGAARGMAQALFVTLGTGVGGAVALDGRVLRTPGDRLGEIGHQVVVPDGGRTCGCGARGCLETVAGGRALVDIALGAGARLPVRDGAATDLPTVRDVVDAAAAGDPAARAALNGAGRALGLAVGNLLAYLGLRTVVLGGGMAPALDWMRPALDEELSRRRGFIGDPDLRLAELGPHAGAIGAALLAAQPEGGAWRGTPDARRKDRP
jgi:glucokinase